MLAILKLCPLVLMNWHDCVQKHTPIFHVTSHYWDGSDRCALTINGKEFDVPCKHEDAKNE